MSRSWPAIYCGVAPPAEDPTYPAFHLEATGKGVGAFFWQHDKKVVWIMMPCEPLMWSRFPIAPYKIGESDNWEWNGILDRPTLSPSLHWPNHWHGYLRNGQLVEA